MRNRIGWLPVANPFWPEHGNTPMYDGEWLFEDMSVYEQRVMAQLLLKLGCRGTDGRCVKCVYRKSLKDKEKKISSEVKNAWCC